jgi:uncharacterized membrane protein
MAPDQGQTGSFKTFWMEVSMNLLLAFTPFIVFVIVERLVGIAVGLAAGAVAAAALLMRDLVTPGHSVKLLELGTLLLFGGLTLLQLAIGEQWSIGDVRLRVDAGLLLIVLLTMMLGRPFSLQYARERVAPAHWNDPDFMRVNYVISGAWALAFGVLVVADVVIDVLPGLPRLGSVVAIVAALWAAAWFTGWYPEQHGRHMAGRT